MSTQHEIILIDGGDQITPSNGGAPTTDMPMVAPPVNPRVEPAPRWKGEPEANQPRGSKGPSAAESAGTIAATVGKILGGGPLINAAQELARAFSNVKKSVENIANRATMDRATVTPSAAPVASPAAAPVSAPAAPAIDPVSGKPNVNVDIQKVIPAPPRAGGPVAAPPVARPGLPVPAAAPVAGPAAGGATAAQGLASLAKFAGPAAIAVAGLTAAVAAGAMVVKGVFDALNNQVKQLEGVSADVSVATSITDMRREMADIRRAEKIGPDIARFENIRSKFEDKAADLWTEVLKVLVKIFEAVEPAVDLMTDGIEVMTAGVEVLGAQIDTVKAALTKFDTKDDLEAAVALIKATGKLTAAIIEMGNNKEEEDPNDPFMQMLLAQFAPGGQI